jgi:hypothetical protein
MIPAILCTPERKAVYRTAPGGDVALAAFGVR